MEYPARISRTLYQHEFSRNERVRAREQRRERNAEIRRTATINEEKDKNGKSKSENTLLA